jgi:hypothetical protein
MTREEQIKKRKIWQVTKDGAPDDILFEGPKTKAFAFLKTVTSLRLWKRGKSGYSIGYLIWENPV